MPLTISKANQNELLEAAMTLTESEGWHKDAVAFSATQQGSPNGPSYIGVFQNFAGGGAEIHFATIGAMLNRSVINAYKSLAFHPRMLGLKRLTANVAASNGPGQRACLAAGFEFEYRKRSSVKGGEDAIVFSLAP